MVIPEGCFIIPRFDIFYVKDVVGVAVDDTLIFPYIILAYIL